MATAAKKTSGKTLKITQIRSAAGTKPGMKETLTGLGLRRLHHTVERADAPALRGMLFKVRHLVKVEE
ncbi:MAG: 50S ribosomal protein L30 [Bdellovibrionales bacterium]